MRRVGVDVGGTFTDTVFLRDDGSVVVRKVPTTPSDPSIGTVTAVGDALMSGQATAGAVDQILHGTTIATNMVIEHTGSRVGLLTTEGFRDILHIARHKRPLNFSLYQDLPWQQYPLVLRRHRCPVPERLGPSGVVVVPLDEGRVRQQVRYLKEEGVEAIAIGFLFAFADDSHEQRAEAIVREEFPGCFVSTSADMVRQYREYERIATAVLNAYVGPRVAEYITKLAERLESRGVISGLHVMTSSGGVVTAADAIARPVHLLMSGPVAGVVGGISAGSQAGCANVITLDVGGTSADIGLAEGGRVKMKPITETQIGPYLAMIPMVDLDTIGAGGGSVAFVDTGGVYRVGPRSAGADPGPAAYGRGGTEPTATDAMVNLGWLPAAGLLDGEMVLQAEASYRAFERGPALTLGMSVEKASMGAVEILIHTLAQAIERNSVQKGYDPRDFVLVAGGGAGPLFAAYVAEEASIPAVIVPTYPGLMSAVGLLSTDVVYELGTTVYLPLTTETVGLIRASFAQLEARGTELLESAGIPANKRVIERIAECRYSGQGYELRVDCPGGTIDEAWLEHVRAAFDRVHEREFSRSFEGDMVEIPNVRIRAIGLMERPAPPRLKHGAESAEAALNSEGKAWFRQDRGMVCLNTKYFDRRLLEAGNLVSGPAVICQYDATTLIPPGFEASVDEFGTLRLMATSPNNDSRLASRGLGSAVLGPQSIGKRSF